MNGYGGPGGYPPGPQGPPQGPWGPQGQPQGRGGSQGPHGPQDPYRHRGPYGQQGQPGPYGVYPPPPAQPPVPPPPPPPIPPTPPPARRPSSAPSYLWALAPLYTCGFGAPFSMMYAAIRRRSVGYGLASAGYATATAVWIYLSEKYEDTQAPPLASFLMILCMLTPWLFGTVHSLAVRRHVFGDAAPYETGNEQAIALAQHRRALRQQARELAERDPVMAREVRIGRPDLPRQYDDGGLIDVNHAPASVIANLPGLTSALAEQIVRVRDQVGGFVSAEDVSAAASLPPHLTADLAEYGIFLP